VDEDAKMGTERGGVKIYARYEGEDCIEGVELQKLVQWRDVYPVFDISYLCCTCMTM
jgi:hypothetical protein